MINQCFVSSPHIHFSALLDKALTAHYTNEVRPEQPIKSPPTLWPHLALLYVQRHNST